MDNHEIKKPVTVFIEAYASDDDGDGPAYIRLDVDQAFVDRLKKLHGLVAENVLSELRVYALPDEWDAQEELDLVNSELVLTSSEFWFTADVSHTDYNAESRGQNIDAFINAVQAHEGSEPIYLGSDIEYLKRITQEEDDDTSDEASERFINAKGDEKLLPPLGEMVQKVNTVPVGYWNDSHYTGDSENTEGLRWTCQINDQRQSSGQLYVDLYPVEGDLDDGFSLTIEVNRLGQVGVSMPCVHVHFASGDRG